MPPAQPIVIKHDLRDALKVRDLKTLQDTAWVNDQVSFIVEITSFPLHLKYVLL